MTKIMDLVPIFEQTAARRAQDALFAQVTACFVPLRDHPLTDADYQEIDRAGRAYAREYNRHLRWLERRFENAGMNFRPHDTLPAACRPGTA